MKTRYIHFLLVFSLLSTLGLSKQVSAEEQNSYPSYGDYEEAAWLSFRLSKQADSLSYQDPYGGSDGIYDDDDYGYPGPRRPRDNAAEIGYAASELQQTSLDLYYTLRFLRRSDRRGLALSHAPSRRSQIIRHFRCVKAAYSYLARVAPYWEIAHISSTFDQLESALMGYDSRW